MASFLKQIEADFEHDVVSPAERAVATYIYMSVGMGGVYAILMPSAEPAVIPWVGLALGAVLLREAPSLKRIAGGLGGLGAGVFVAETLGFSTILSAGVGAAAGQMWLNP
jgi:hypothetical protein